MIGTMAQHNLLAAASSAACLHYVAVAGREIGGQCAWPESESDAWMASRPARKYKSREVA